MSESLGDFRGNSIVSPISQKDNQSSQGPLKIDHKVVGTFVMSNEAY
jgi:hypothetical protein